MKNLIIFMGDIPKDVTTLLYVACGALVSVITYLYVSHKTQIKEKDDAIRKVMEEHRNDIKEGNEDYRRVVDKFSHFMSQIELIIRDKKR
jgi:hypothetical protein